MVLTLQVHGGRNVHVLPQGRFVGYKISHFHNDRFPLVVDALFLDCSLLISEAYSIVKLSLSTDVENRTRAAKITRRTSILTSIHPLQSCERSARTTTRPVIFCSGEQHLWSWNLIQSKSHLENNFLLHTSTQPSLIG
jgi:hypothetical protein